MTAAGMRAASPLTSRGVRVGKQQREIAEHLPAAEVPGCPAASRGGYGRGRSTYVRRRPEDTVLHRVVREHLETFLAEARLRGGGICRVGTAGVTEFCIDEAGAAS